MKGEEIVRVEFQKGRKFVAQTSDGLLTAALDSTAASWSACPLFEFRPCPGCAH
jgi:hypothetical protein